MWVWVQVVSDNITAKQVVAEQTSYKINALRKECVLHCIPL